jgi:hypothetical protein
MHTAHSTQHTAHSTQHTAHSTQLVTIHPAHAGPIPGAVFSQPYLQELDLSHNKLSGNLGEAGVALEGNSVNYLSFLELSNNELSGDLPASLSRLAMLDITRGDLLGSDLLPLPRVFSIGNNQFSGAFPTYVLDSFPRLVEFCSQVWCNATVSVAGPNMKLSCPSPNDISTNITSLEPYELECIKGDGSRVDVISFLLDSGAGTGPGSSSYSASSSPSSSGAAPGSKSGPAAKMGPGTIAGLVVGLLVGIAVLASVAYVVGYKKYYREHKVQAFERMGAESAAPHDSAVMSAEMVRQTEAGSTQDPALAPGRADESV